MNERKKEAINLLNKLKDSMTEEEYFLLMDFIITPQQVYSPLPSPSPQPLEPFYKLPWEVTCKTSTTRYGEICSS